MGPRKRGAQIRVSAEQREAPRGTLLMAFHVRALRLAERTTSVCPRAPHFAFFRVGQLHISPALQSSAVEGWWRPPEAPCALRRSAFGLYAGAGCPQVGVWLRVHPLGSTSAHALLRPKASKLSERHADGRLYKQEDANCSRHSI